MISLQISIPIKMVLLFNNDGIFGNHGMLPILLEICINILVRMDVNPFLAKVVVKVIWVNFGFYELRDSFFIVL